MARPLTIYSTLSRSLEIFEPLRPPAVGLYSCGPTVYNYAHIGNLRSYVFADTLKRVLRANGFQVEHVMNITDVGHLTGDADEGEDKMEQGARREGRSVWDIAEHYTQQFRRDLDALRILPPDVWCKATAHIEEQIAQVRALECKGFTYQTEDGVYFDTSRLEDYGKLARLNIDELRQGARVEMGQKRHKTDFALWKFSPRDKQRQMEWPSPWGTGFPGWHIECSAMSMKYLGDHFDIHTGGIDHIPVHHTNEIAQAEAATGEQPWVKYWLHGEFLVMDQGKMAKSGESFLTLAMLVRKGYEPLDYRYFCLGAHYRQQLKFSWEAMETAKQSRARLMNILDELRRAPARSGAGDDEALNRFPDEFLDALNDDLNTPRALAVLWSALRAPEIGKDVKIALVASFEPALGLALLEESAEAAPADVRQLAEERERARRGKDWKRSDELRQEILARGWQVVDEKGGFRLKRL